MIWQWRHMIPLMFTRIELHPRNMAVNGHQDIKIQKSLADSMFRCLVVAGVVINDWGFLGNLLNFFSLYHACEDEIARTMKGNT